MRQNKLATQDVVVMYTQQHLTLREIATLVGMSHTAIAKRLKSAGVTAHDGQWLTLPCGFCGSLVERRRSQSLNHKEVYCNTECYYASRESPGYKPWRQGQRIARAIVAQYFKLEPQHVVDHRDGNNRNNDRNNLRVYASQSDHIKMHHGKTPVEPLWDGAIVL